jgi:hypothetical protein
MSETEHMDEDSTEAAIEQPEHHPVLPEAWRQVFALIELAADPKGFKRRLHGLANALAAASAAQLALSTDRAALAADRAKQIAEIEAMRASATKRLLAAQEAERTLEARHETVLKLERAWSGLTLPGEPPPLMARSQRRFAGVGPHACL